MAVSQFNAPIPGQSLTTKPGNVPWERPPEYNTVEETMAFYLKHLSKSDVIDDTMVLLEVGFPVKPLVKSLRISNTMKGKHNLDVGLLVEPFLVKFITATAESLDVPYKMGDVDLKKDAAEKENRRISMLLDAALSKNKATPEEDEGVALLEDIAENIDTSAEPEMPADVEPEMQEQEQPATPQGAGLMARG